MSDKLIKYYNQYFIAKQKQISSHYSVHFLIKQPISR